MARRSSQIQLEDPRETVAKVIWEHWFRLNQERTDWLNRGLEARRYVTASDTNATEVGSLPWKNKTTIPKLTHIVDGLVSYYMAALMPSDDWFIWEGADEASQIKAEIIQKYMRNKIRMSNFRTELKKIIHDWVMYGTCFGGVTWVKEYTKSARTGERIVNYVGPKLYRVSPIDCCIDPRAASFENTPFFERCLVSVGDILDHNANGSSPHYNEDAVQKVIDNRSPGPAKNTFVDYYKESGLEIDGFGTIDSYLDSGLVEIVTYWGNIYVPSTGEYKKNRVITIADGATVLSNDENPAWNGKKPFGMAIWRVLPDNLYGQSPIDNLVGMQYRCDHLENLKADAFDQIIHPVVIIKGDTGEDYQWVPGAKWTVPVDGDVTVLRPDATVLTADNQIAMYHSYMEQMAGVPREAMGFRTPGEKTAFEVSYLQQGADRQFIDKVMHFEESMIEPILNLMFEMLIRNLDIEDIARVFNEDTGALEIFSITKEDVVADGTLRPVGAKHFAARNKRIQELRTLLELAATSNIGLHISGVNAAKMLSEELGWDKYKIIQPFIALKDQMMAKMQQQQIQEQLGAGQMGEPQTGMEGLEEEEPDEMEDEEMMDEA